MSNIRIICDKISTRRPSDFNFWSRTARASNFPTFQTRKSIIVLYRNSVSVKQEIMETFITKCHHLPESYCTSRRSGNCSKWGVVILCNWCKCGAAFCLRLCLRSFSLWLYEGGGFATYIHGGAATAAGNTRRALREASKQGNTSLKSYIQYYHLQQ